MSLRPQIEQAAKRQILISDWQERNITFFSALEVERNVMFFILLLIVIVAALNIICGLTMLVSDKGHDIAILRTMGATRGSILRVFFIAGASIGTIGTLLGFALGVVVCLNIEPIRAIHLAHHRHADLLARALFPEPAARPHGPSRDRDGDRHVAGAVVPGDDLPGLAGGPARSGRGAALRMSDASPARGDARQKRPVLRLVQVERHYREAAGTLSVLSGADFDMYPGEIVALVAPSGAGKSTLLHIAGLLERPDAGDVEIAGRGTGRLSDRERTAIRRVQIGFVYQFHHLLPEFTALENVVMPQLIRGLDRKLAQPAGDAAPCLYAGEGARQRIGRASFPAASSSASRSPAPSPTARACSSPTSRPAISIRRPRPSSSTG